MPTLSAIRLRSAWLGSGFFLNSFSSSFCSWGLVRRLRFGMRGFSAVPGGPSGRSGGAGDESAHALNATRWSAA